MPLVRVDTPASIPPAKRRQIGEAVHAAMVDILDVPVDDIFQVITAHQPDALVITPLYLGIEKSADAILIQITLNIGRPVELKQAFYRAVADALSRDAALRPEDVFINLVEVTKENWSFGNGQAQYVT